MNITAFAQYAGVSKAAVSRYFNGGYLSAEKRAQIAAAVEATGYRPSMQAQMLRTRLVGTARRSPPGRRPAYRAGRCRCRDHL